MHAGEHAHAFSIHTLRIGHVILCVYLGKKTNEERKRERVCVEELKREDTEAHAHNKAQSAKNR